LVDYPFAFPLQRTVSIVEAMTFCVAPIDAVNGGVNAIAV